MKILISDGDRHKNVESGYGRTSAAIVSGLVDYGHEVRFGSFPDADTCLFVCPPYSIREIPHRPAAAYCMHELETLPPEKADWPGILNRLDLLITPTEWNRQIWQRVGVTIPIEVVPEGIDTDIYRPVTGPVCTFLSVHSNLGSSSSRERWRDTVSAYLSAFGPDDAVRLVIKTWGWKPDQWRTELPAMATELGLDLARTPAIEVIDERLTGDEMRALYQRCWLFVKNADREGWSLPCTEAMACGRPIAASRIEPLISVLPAATSWFELGDVAVLRSILVREYERFQAHLGECRRYPASVMGERIGGLLKRLVAGYLVRSPT